MKSFLIILFVSLFSFLTVLQASDRRLIHLSAVEQDTPSASAADSAIGYMQNEISFGIGPSYSPEKDIFNVPSDAAAGTNVGINLTYYRNLTERYAIGVAMYGYFKSIDNVTVTSGGSSKIITLNFSTFNVSASGKYFFSRGNMNPYVFVVAGYSSGSVHNDELGDLNLHGFSGGGGAGVGFTLGTNWLLSIEGLASFGSAKWSEAPFTNSTGTDFNPGILAGYLKIGYCWND